MLLGKIRLQGCNRPPMQVSGSSFLGELFPVARQRAILCILLLLLVQILQKRSCIKGHAGVLLLELQGLFHWSTSQVFSKLGASAIILMP